MEAPPPTSPTAVTTAVSTGVAMEVNVKSGAGGKSFKVDGIESTSTVLALKEKVAANPECGIAVSQQRLFLKGRLLKDEDTLEGAKITDKATLFLVKGAATSGAGAAASTAGAAKEEAKKEPEEPLVTVPCVGGCGFFGTIKTDNYCSSCFKKKADKEKAEADKSKEKKEEKTEGEAAAKEGDAKAGEASAEAEPERPKQEDRTKCWICSKKCGLTGFDCRCGYVFCAKHRHAEDHDCDFDHMGRGRKILAKNMPNIAVKGHGLLDGA